MPRKTKKLHTREEDDDELLEQREEYAEDSADDNFSITYGVCDWCDIEHYLVEFDKPYEAELCQFCIKKLIKELELAYNKLKIVSSNSP